MTHQISSRIPFSIKACVLLAVLMIAEPVNAQWRITTAELTNDIFPIAVVPDEAPASAFIPAGTGFGNLTWNISAGSTGSLREGSASTHGHVRLKRLGGGELEHHSHLFAEAKGGRLRGIRFADTGPINSITIYEFRGRLQDLRIEANLSGERFFGGSGLIPISSGRITVTFDTLLPPPAPIFMNKTEASPPTCPPEIRNHVFFDGDKITVRITGSITASTSGTFPNTRPFLYGYSRAHTTASVEIGSR